MMVGILLGDSPTRQVRWHVSKYRGKPVLLHTLEAMHRSNLDQILMVIGRDYHLILNRMRIPRDRVRVIMNHRYERGLSSYLKAGIMSLPPETSAVMIVPGEYCQLTSQIIDEIAASFTRNNRGILIPTYDGEKGFPVVFHQKFIQPVSRVRKDDLGQSVIDKYPGEVIEEEISSPAVINSFSRIRATETSEIENVTFGKKEKTGIKGQNGHKPPARNGAPSTVKRDLPSSPPKAPVFPSPAKKAQSESAIQPAGDPVAIIQEPLQETPKTQAVPHSELSREPAGKVQPPPVEDHRPQPQGVSVPPMNRSKKKIIEKLKKKVEARVREEKQKIISRRRSDEVDVQADTGNNRDEDLPLEIPRRREAQSGDVQEGNTGHSQPSFDDSSEKKDNFSLKMLNDLLGRGKEKKQQ